VLNQVGLFTSVNATYVHSFITSESANTDKPIIHIPIYKTYKTSHLNKDYLLTMSCL